MDINKFKKFVKIGYCIKRCCGECAHRNFEKKSLWGSCMLHKYDHMDTTDYKTNMSIFLFGSYEDFKIDDGMFDKFNDFV